MVKKVSNTFNFSIENMEIMEEMNNSLFRKVRIRAFASGENTHTLPIDEDVLRRGAKTIYNKPILWKYNKYIDDAMSHEKDEVPCGFVPENEDNPILFERENDRVFIVINALLWTRYCGRLIKIYHRDGMEKDVSIEIATINDENADSNKPKVEDFVISGITILGEYVNPACKGCKSELLEFSEDKNKYLDTLALMEKYTKSDKNLSNSKRNLLECYKNIGLNSYDSILNKKNEGDEKMQKETKEEMVDETKEVGCEKMEEDNDSSNNEETKDGDTTDDKDDIDDDDDKDDKDDDDKGVDDNSEQKMSEMESKIKRLEEENTAYMAKIDAMSDYEDLKKYKEMAEEKDKKEKEFAEMNKVMASIEERGIEMSDEDKKSIMEKIKDFQSVDAWVNFAKAQVFDRAEKVDSIVKIGLPFQNSNTTSGSIWDKI